MSKPHIDQEQLFLYMQNALTFEEMTNIESHLEECQTCQKQSIEMKKWFNLFNDGKIYDIEDDALIRARNRLNFTLDESAPRKKAKRIFSSIPSHIATKQLAMGMALIIVGVLMGRFLWPNFPATSNPNMLAELQSSPSGTYEIVPSATHPDQVEIRLRNLEEHTFQGNIKDPDISTALAYNLMTEERDNFRIRTMNMIQAVSQDETVENALLHTLANDSNPGLRYKAIKLLRQFPINDKMKELLIRVLFQEENPGVRIQVTEKLIQSNDPDIRFLLENRAKKDEYVQYVLDAADTKQALSISHE